jgi:uncharacterized protein (DUF1778 family)
MAKKKVESKNSTLRIRLTQAEREIVEAAAARAGYAASTWARPIIVRAAKESAK